MLEGGLAELQRRREAARAEGRIYGIGYATVVEPSQSNMGYISTLKTGLERERAGQKDGAIASCVVNVDPLGAVSVTADSVPQGQGHQTALAQVVADRLGIDPADIAVNLETDTQKDGWSIAAGNYSCRFAPAVASSVHIAASNIRAKVARIASQTLNVPPDDLEFERGRVFARDNPENSVAFYRAAGVAHWSPLSLPDGMTPGLREAVDWSAPELTPTTANDEINTSLAYGFGFDFCGIEIDRATGEIRIDKYVTSHDCGTILNPGLAEGQIRGSFAAAFGATMLEEFVYAEDGSFPVRHLRRLPGADRARDARAYGASSGADAVALHAPRRQGDRRGQPVLDPGVLRQRGRRCARYRGRRDAVDAVAGLRVAARRRAAAARGQRPPSRRRPRAARSKARARSRCRRRARTCGGC